MVYNPKRSFYPITQQEDEDLFNQPENNQSELVSPAGDGQNVNSYQLPAESGHTITEGGPEQLISKTANEDSTPPNSNLESGTLNLESQTPKVSDFFNNVLEESGLRKKEIEKQNFDRKKYLEKNIRAQKWGEAFKSLVDITGALANADVKQRDGRNDILSGYIKELNDLPYKQRKELEELNDRILNFQKGERDYQTRNDQFRQNQQRLEQQSQWENAYKAYQAEIKHALDADKRDLDRQKFELDKKNADRLNSYRSNQIRLQEARLNKTGNKTSGDATQQPAIQTSIRTSTGENIPLQLTSEQVNSLYNYFLRQQGSFARNDAEELDYSQKPTGKLKTRIKDKDVFDAVMQDLYNMTDTLSNKKDIDGFIQFVNQFNPQASQLPADSAPLAADSAQNAGFPLTAENAQTPETSDKRTTLPQEIYQANQRRINAALSDFVSSNPALLQAYQVNKQAIEEDMNDLLDFINQGNLSLQQIQGLISEFISETQNSIQEYAG